MENFRKRENENEKYAYLVFREIEFKIKMNIWGKIDIKNKEVLI